MKSLKSCVTTLFLYVSLSLCLFANQLAFADGTETLGTPSIPISSGTGVISSGVGLAVQPGDIEFTVPAGATVNQVLLYWEGQDTSTFTGDPDIVVNGTLVGGAQIGGPVFWLDNGVSTTYRADITGLGIVAPGANVLTLSGLNFTNFANGAGVIVIVDDGSASSILQIRDGNDLAFKNWPAPKDTTVPQTFSFPAATSSRSATLTLIVSAVEGSNSGGGPVRPNAVDVTVGGVTTTYDNALDSLNGEEWDTLVLPVEIPAGATDLTVQLLSIDNLGLGGLPASLTWNAAALSIRPVDQPPTAALGDRVWEDRNSNGIQDCADTNENGIIGDAGDIGPECDAGIPMIPVSLLTGDCETSLGQTVMTDMNGLYLFDNLAPGAYCVEFGNPPGEFCDTDGFDLGKPQFTSKNTGGDDAVDSDANPDDGKSDPVSLSSGETNRMIDAGIVCPAKIGDFVWFDDNGNGLQDENEDGVPGVKTTLFECGPDMVAGTSDDVMTSEMRVTDEGGMYMFGGEPNVYDLPPGKYFVKFDPTTFPMGYDFTTPNGGPDDLDSDCLPPEGITACTDLTASRTINLNRDCGLIPPPPPDCNLFLDKFCRVEAPPPEPFDRCNGKLQQFTLIWTGAGPITAAGPNNTETVNTGDEATFFGPFNNNDVIVNISGAVSGQSEFHVSCSDDDFNDPSDCGKLAGNGKGNDSGLINAWRLEGFVDADGRVLNCTGDSDGSFSDNCTFEPEPLPSCDNGPKPETLTWRYDGGTGGDGACADSTFFSIVNADGKMHVDFMCSGTVNTALQITATDDGGNTFLVNPGDSFTVLRDDSKTITLTDSAGGTQDLEFHTSCSQPLEAQATAGALTLAGLDNRDGAQDVTYRYELTNFGDPLTNVSIEDNPLGTIVSGLTLDSNQSASFEAMAQIFGTTVNTAQASGTLEGGGVCAPSSAFDSVTVEAVIPPCSIGIELYNVEDDKLKIKLTNNDTRNRTVTMQNLEVSYPAARGIVEKVKLDGDAYKFGESAAPIVNNPAIFGPGDWTATDITKRQIKPGDTKTLEFETFDKSSKDGRFEVTVDFGDGCVLFIVVENQQIVN